MNKPVPALTYPTPKTQSTFLGLLPFKWSMTLLGLCIYSFSIITFRFPLAQLGIALGITGLLSNRVSIRLPTPFWLYFGFLLWALASSFVSSFQDIALSEVLERFKMLIVMLIAMNALRTEGQLRFYLLFVLGCFILFPTRGTFLGGNYILEGRVVWNYIYSNPNDLATLSLIAFGVALALIFSEPSWNLLRFGTAISAILLFIVILRTQSRGVFVAIIVMIAPAFMTMLLKQLRLAISVGVVVALLISFAIPAKVWDRLSGITHLTSTEAVQKMRHKRGISEPDSSSLERFEILKVGWQIFLDNPIGGVGLGAYKFANGIYAPYLGKRDTHNTYVNLAAETGLPGLVLWCALVGSVLSYAYRARRQAKAGMLKVQQYWLERTLVGYLVASLFGSYSALNFFYIMLSVLWCSATLLAKSTRQIHQDGTRRL